jgi:hypothetical protein
MEKKEKRQLGSIKSMRLKLCLTHMIIVRKGDKNELERENVGEQERGKTEYRR